MKKDKINMEGGHGPRYKEKITEHLQYIQHIGSV